jgi:predicted metal-dependent hydrolase
MQRKMALIRESKYPSRRAYVVKLRSDALPHALIGRVENLVSGRQREFGSAQELLETLARDLEAMGDGTDETQGL